MVLNEIHNKLLAISKLASEYIVLLLITYLTTYFTIMLLTYLIQFVESIFSKATLVTVLMQSIVK